MTDLISIMLSASICWRIVAYRPNGAQYRPLISVAAYLLAMGAGCYGLSVALGVEQASPFVVVVLALIAAIVWRAGGNVASVLRVKWSE